MPNLALLLINSGDHLFPIEWGSKILPKEIYFIIDAGNALLWIYEGKSGKWNRIISDQWAHQLLQKKISIEKWGIHVIPREVVKVDEKVFQKILALPNEPAGGSKLVNIAIPPPAQLIPSNHQFSFTPEPSKALIGMIKVQHAVDVNQAAQLLRMTPDDVRVLLFTLAADDKIKGQFEGDIFKIASDVEDFIAALDQQFASWGEKGQAGKTS